MVKSCALRKDEEALVLYLQVLLLYVCRYLDNVQFILTGQCYKLNFLLLHVLYFSFFFKKGNPFTEVGLPLVKECYSKFLPSVSQVWFGLVEAKNSCLSVSQVWFGLVEAQSSCLQSARYGLDGLVWSNQKNLAFCQPGMVLID